MSTKKSTKRTTNKNSAKSTKKSTKKSCAAPNKFFGMIAILLLGAAGVLLVLGMIFYTVLGNDGFFKEADTSKPVAESSNS